MRRARSRPQPASARAKSRGAGSRVDDPAGGWDSSDALHVLPVVFCASADPQGPDRDLEPREYASTCLLLQDSAECGSLRLPEPDIVIHADRHAPLPLRELTIIDLPQRTTDAVRLAVSSPNNRCSAFLLRNNSVILRQGQLYLLPPLGSGDTPGSASYELPEERVLAKVEKTGKLPSSFAMRGRGYEQYPLERTNGTRVATLAVGDQGDLVAVADDGTVLIRDHLLGLGPAGAQAGGPDTPSFYSAFRVFPDLADEDDIFQNPEEGGLFTYAYAAAIPPADSDITDLDEEVIVCRVGVNNHYVRVDRVVFLGPRRHPSDGAGRCRFSPYALRPVLLELGSYDDTRSVSCSLAPLGTILAVVYNGMLVCLPVRLRYCRGCDADPGNPCDYCRRKRLAGAMEGDDMFAATRGVYRTRAEGVGPGSPGFLGASETAGSARVAGEGSGYLEDSGLLGREGGGVRESAYGPVASSPLAAGRDTLVLSAGPGVAEALGRVDGMEGPSAGRVDASVIFQSSRDLAPGRTEAAPQGPEGAHMLYPGQSLDYSLQKEPERNSLGRARVLHDILYYVPHAAVDRCSVTTTNVAELVATFLGSQRTAAKRAQSRLEVCGITWSQDNAIFALMFPDMILFCTAFGSPLDVRLHSLGLENRIPGHEDHDCQFAGAGSCQSVGPLLAFNNLPTGSLVGQFLGGRDILVKANRGVRVFRLELGYNRNAGSSGVAGGAGGIVIYPERWWNRAGVIAMVQGVRETPVLAPVQYYRDLTRMLVYSTAFVQEFMWATMLCTARSQLAAVSAQSVQGLGADSGLAMESDLASTYLILLTELNARVQALLDRKLRLLLEKMGTDLVRAAAQELESKGLPFSKRQVENDCFTEIYEVCHIPYLLVSARLSIRVTPLLLHCAGGLYTTITNSILEALDPDGKPGEKSIVRYFYDSLLGMLSSLSEPESKRTLGFSEGAPTAAQRALAGRSAEDVLSVAMVFAKMSGALGKFYVRVDSTCRNYGLPAFTVYNVALGFACLAADVAAIRAPSGAAASGEGRAGAIAAVLARKLSQRLGFGGLYEYVCASSAAKPGWVGDPEAAVSSPRPCPYLAVYLLHQFYSTISVHPAPELGRRPAGKPMVLSDIALLLHKSYGSFISTADRPAGDFYVECVGSILRGEDTVFAGTVLRERAKAQGGSGGEGEDGEIRMDSWRAVRAGIVNASGIASPGRPNRPGGDGAGDSRGESEAVVYVLNQLLGLSDLAGALSLVFENSATGGGASAGAPSCRRDAERVCERLRDLAGAVPESWVVSCRDLVAKMTTPIAEWLLQLCTACMASTGVFPHVLLPAGDKTLIEPRRAYVRDVTLGEYFHLLVCALPPSSALLLTPYMAAALSVGLGLPARGVATLLGSGYAKMAGYLLPTLMSGFPKDKHLKRLSRAIERDPEALERIDAQLRMAGGKDRFWAAPAPSRTNDAGVGGSRSGADDGGVFDNLLPVQQSGITDVAVDGPGAALGRPSGISESFVREMREIPPPAGPAGYTGPAVDLLGVPGPVTLGGASNFGNSASQRPTSKMVVPKFKLSKRAQPDAVGSSAPAPAAQAPAFDPRSAPYGPGAQTAPAPVGLDGGVAAPAPGQHWGFPAPTPALPGGPSAALYGSQAAVPGQPPVLHVPGSLDNPYSGEPVLDIYSKPPGTIPIRVPVFSGGWGTQEPRTVPPLIPARGIQDLPRGDAPRVQSVMPLYGTSHSGPNAKVDERLPFGGMFAMPEPPPSSGALGLPGRAEARPFASSRPANQPYYAVPPGTRPGETREVLFARGDMLEPRHSYHDELRSGAASNYRNPVYPSLVRGPYRGSADEAAKASRPSADLPSPSSIAKLFEVRQHEPQRVAPSGVLLPMAGQAGARAPSGGAGPAGSTGPVGPEHFGDGFPDDLTVDRRKGWRYVRGYTPDGKGGDPAPVGSSGPAWPVLPPASAPTGKKDPLPPFPGLPGCSDDGGHTELDFSSDPSKPLPDPRTYHLVGHHEYPRLQDAREERGAAPGSWNRDRPEAVETYPLPPWEAFRNPPLGSRASYHERVPFAQPVGRSELDIAKGRLRLPVYPTEPRKDGPDGPIQSNRSSVSHGPPAFTNSRTPNVPRLSPASPQALHSPNAPINPMSTRFKKTTSAPPGSKAHIKAADLRNHTPATAPPQLRGLADPEGDAASALSWIRTASSNAERSLRSQAGAAGHGNDRSGTRRSRSPSGMAPDDAEGQFT